MLETITVWGAFFAGVLSFASPCVLPLVPPYLGYLAGVSLEALTVHGEREARLRAFTTALAFVLGFSTVFVTLGATASVIGQFVLQHSQALNYIAGAAIIVMGLHFLGVFRIPLLFREARVTVTRKPPGILGAYIMGLAFAFGWTPCIGPVLAAILFVAGSEETATQGAALLAAYSLGIGLPFLGASLFAGPFMRLMSRFRHHMGTVEKAMGVVLIATGVAFLTGQIANVSFWLLETFPAFQYIG